jgi:hypothetical protein
MISKHRRKNVAIISAIIPITLTQPMSGLARDDASTQQNGASPAQDDL